MNEKWKKLIETIGTILLVVVLIAFIGGYGLFFYYEWLDTL